MKKLIILFTILNTNLKAFECESNIDYSLPSIRLGESSNSKNNFWLNSGVTESTCFDEKPFAKDEEFNKTYKKLIELKTLDSNNCIAERKLTDDEAKLLAEISIKTLQHPLHIYALTDQKTGELKKVVVSNSEDPKFAKNALTARDKIDLAGITLLSSGIGILIERQAFKGQHDKLLHSNYGALINIGSNVASYVVIEELGVEDKLKLTRNQKKAAILLTGTAMGAIIGYAKERFYDYYRQKYHTYDPHFKGDMGATMLGGGVVTPMLISFGTSW